MLSSQWHLYITLLMCEQKKKKQNYWLLFPKLIEFQTKQKVGFSVLECGDWLHTNQSSICCSFWPSQRPWLRVLLWTKGAGSPGLCAQPLVPWTEGAGPVGPLLRGGVRDSPSEGAQAAPGLLSVWFWLTAGLWFFFESYLSLCFSFLPWVCGSGRRGLGVEGGKVWAPREAFLCLSAQW